MKILSFIITLLISVNLHAQIKLPKGFRCVYGENHIDESFFTDGTYFFSSYPWGRSGLYGREVIEAIEKNHNNKLKFKPTKDGLY